MVAGNEGTLSEDIEFRWRNGLSMELRKRLGTGGTLDAATRAAFERWLQVDLGDTRIHVGPLAGRLAASAGARGFTVGTNVVAPRAILEPTTEGRALLGHELVHVAQHVAQPQSRIQRTTTSDLSAELAASSFEAELSTSPARRTHFEPDAAVVADSVYRKLLDELQSDHWRAS